MFVDYILIVVGTFLLAISISWFYEPFNLVTGGVSGLGIIIKHYSSGIMDGGIPVGITNAIFNIPLFFIAILVRGKGFGIKSLVSAALLSVFLIMTSNMAPPIDDLLLATIFGGVISGAGLGLVFSAYATTGGTDLAASLVQKFFPHITVAVFMLILDWSIILGGMYVFGIKKSLYAIIAVYITAKVIDMILDGLNFAKAALIISDKQDEIAQNIMESLNRGATGFKAKGMWSREDKSALICVVSKRQIVKLKDIVKATDRNAFVVITDAREVHGEGFIE